ncbi:MAG: peptidoglycan DD-metalloendopeptidase family protein [Patescibacteria group bacterium]|nr:peptidoglycan DD-metalloendopeptidase family protein [Patescibacteria group bacterium]MDD4610663.1 peptidoglycan DD-metalloendopeptidase family protein [Patescibacteria group bacterium]
MTAFFIVVSRPLGVIWIFIYKKIIIKLYSLYLSFLKTFGWTAKDSLLNFILSKRASQFLVLILTLIIILNSFVSKTQASISEQAHNTILSSLVPSEFGDIEDDYLIEELPNEGATSTITSGNYLEQNEALGDASKTGTVVPEIQEESEEIGAITEGGLAIRGTEFAATKKTKQPRQGVIEYTVKIGDTVSTIAEDFEISVNTILWENNLSAFSLIRPGQIISILPVTGVVHKVVRGENLGKISSLYNVESQKIMEANGMSNINDLKIGQRLIIPGGSKSRYASSQTARYSGISAIKDMVKPSSASPAAGNKMNWPTQGYRITQYYSWRHHGLDIANKIGTPLYAADAGTVIFAGWSTGYGNNIVIDHGGGKKTRYAHQSKFYVGKGDEVRKGQTIGAMGSTGWSTGSHLHFEVIINGVMYNPLNYIR